MRLVKVENEKFKDPNPYAGEYTVYERAVDTDVPIVNGDWMKLKVGDFIEDCNRLVAPVLSVNISPSDSSRSIIYYYISVVTPFGLDALGKYDSKGRYYWLQLNLLRRRYKFLSLVKHKTETFLSTREKYFLMTAFQNGFENAALAVYGKSFTPRQLDVKLGSLLQCKDAKEYIMNELREELEKRGMHKVDWYLNKIDQSLEDGVDNPTKLVLFKNLASISNVPDVNNLVNPENQNQLPGGGIIPLGEGKKVEEATFSECDNQTTNEELKV